MDNRQVGIKTPEILFDLINHEYHKKLSFVAWDVIDIIIGFGITPVITSAYRDDDPDSVHAHCRGLDFRSWYLSDKMIDELIARINTKWIYDPARPEMVCLIFHDVGQGQHLHLQVHDNTIRSDTI